MPIDKIKICWDFLKYVNVSFVQQNGKPKTRQIERNAIGTSLANTIKTKMKATKNYTEEEIDSYLEFVITTNSLEGLPEEIAKQFTVEDCLVYIPLNEEILQNLNEEVISTIKSIDKCKKVLYIKVFEFLRKILFIAAPRHGLSAVYILYLYYKNLTQTTICWGLV